MGLPSLWSSWPEATTLPVLPAHLFSLPIPYPEMTRAGGLHLCLPRHVTPGTALTSLSLQFFFRGVASLRTVEI